MQRDTANNLKLESLGLKVFRFWEHEIKIGCAWQAAWAK